MVGNTTLPAGAFDFNAASITVLENAGAATIAVTRTGDIANAMTVDYLIVDGSAAGGSDFAATVLPTGYSGTLTFGVGQASASFSIPILDDSLIEGPETLMLSLLRPNNDNVLGAISTAVLTISDDDYWPPDPAPTVTDVRVHFGSQTVSIRGIGRSLPWVNIDAIDIVFSEGVNVNIADLKLTGINVSSYTFKGFIYDSATFTARWDLTTILAVDRLLMTLDGDDASSDGNSGVTDSSASGVPSYLAGGDYLLNFDVLAGDVNGSGRVTKKDVTLIRKQIGTWSLFDDLDGDGDVDQTDVTLARQRLHSRLP